MDGVIIFDDARYKYTKKYLQDKGHVFHDPDTTYTWPALDFIIFPFKDPVDQKRYSDSFFAELNKDVQIFSGIRSSYLTQKCGAHSLKYNVMMEDTGTAVKNAVPTSEGVLAFLVQNMERTIAASRILVVGYGICGRDLSLRLKALGANVHALVRNWEKQSIAMADGVTPLYQQQLHGSFDAVINTVPSTVLSNSCIGGLAPALFVEIASAPYGFDMEEAKRYNSRSAILPGIPGKYAIKTAGQTLGEYVQHCIL